MIRFISLVTMLATGAMVSAVEIGQTRAEVENELGPPESQAEAGERSIARWDTLEVTFVEGRVRNVTKRNLTAEAASEARRKDEAERARIAREQAENEQRRLEQERLAQEERDRPRLELKLQAEKIAALEAQLKAERAKLEELKEKMDTETRTERLARLTTLKQEMARLRLDLEQATAAGENKRVLRLKAELSAKAREFDLLSEKN